MAARGVADAGEGNMVGDFDAWQADHLWPGVTSIFGAQSIDNGTVDRASSPGPHSSTILATVKGATQLTQNEDRPKYSMEIQLPEGTTYDIGDYLDVYPENNQTDVQRLLDVVRRMGHDDKTPLVSALCSGHELNQPASLNVGPNTLRCKGD